MTRRLLAVLALASAASPVLAQDFTFRASTADGPLRAMRLDQFAGDGLIHLAGKENKIFAAEDLIELCAKGVPLPEHAGPPFLVLTSGERLPLEKGTLLWKENRVSALPAAPLKTEGRLAVPLPYLAFICLDHPPGAERLEAVLDRLRRAPRKADFVLLADGDELEGKLLSLDKECHIDAGGRDVRVPASRVALIAVNPARQVSPRFKAPAFHVVTRQGARLDFQTLERGPAVWSGKTIWGAALELPRADLILIQTRGGKAVYLSDLEPAAFTQATPIGWSQPLGRDRTFLGRPLRLPDGVHDKGISIPPGALVRYALDDKHRWFETTVALDAQDGKLGRARLEVQVDDKAVDLGPMKELTAANGPWQVRVDIAKAKTLSLSVQPGSRATETVVDWADARLLK